MVTKVQIVRKLKENLKSEIEELTRLTVAQKFHESKKDKLEIDKCTKSIADVTERIEFFKKYLEELK